VNYFRGQQVFFLSSKISTFSLVLSFLFLSSCTNLFLYPDREIYYTPQIANLEYQEVLFPGSDGNQLSAWYLPAVKESKGSVLFLHGNAGNLSTHLSAVHWLPGEGYNVLMLDYAGFGLSEGSASVEGAHEDSRLALDYMFAHSPGPYFILGQSFGGSVAIYLTANYLTGNYLAANSDSKERISAIIVDSAFSGYRSIATEKLKSTWLTWPLSGILNKTISDRYSASKFVKAVSPIPILFTHTEFDSIVPARHSKILYKKALAPKQLVITEGDLHISSFQVEANRKLMTDFFESAAKKPLNK